MLKFYPRNTQCILVVNPAIGGIACPGDGICDLTLNKLKRFENGSWVLEI